jgi:iron complex transport system ATP-binding protein
MALIATDIDVHLGRRQILHQVCFTAKAGEVTAIVGPNGCGKTTLLRAITGEQAYGGAVSLNGLDIDRADPITLAQMRAVLPQATALAFPFTVLEVVRLGLTAGLATAHPEEAQDLPRRALDRVGLTGFQGRFYQDLSGGEKQRVQLARVLVQVWAPVLDGTPRWLFLDEPVSALDIGHQLLVMEVARDFAQAGGGVVAVMHDLNLTAMYAQRITLMHQGRVLRSGTAQEVISNDTLSRAYGCAISTNQPPLQGGPWLLPQAARLTGHAH